MINCVGKNRLSFVQENVNFRAPFSAQNAESSIQRNISFCGATLYDKFRRSFNALKMSEDVFIKKCIYKKNPFGAGEHALVFKIPIKGFENYVLKVFYNKTDVGNLSKVENIFPHNNFGQPIAKMGEDYLILRKINATPLSRYNEPFYDMELKDKAERYYKILSNLPQKSYDNFIKQMKIANKQGYAFDPGNLGNIMIKDKKLNILDLNKNARGNMLGDPLYAILYNGFCFTNPQILKNKLNILEKIFKASQKEGLRYGMADEAYWCVFEKEGKPFSEKMDNLLNNFLNKKE